MMKNYLCTGIGVIGTTIAGWFGGWDAALTALIAFMAIDYVTGMVVAAFFNNSPKSESGKLESKAGFKGLCRKGTILLFVLIGHLLDMVMGANYIRDGICIGFMANELVSITENAILMGVPVPKIIENAISVLKGKSGNESKEDENNDKK